LRPRLTILRNIQYSGPGYGTISDPSLGIAASTLPSQTIHPPQGSLETPEKTNNNIKFSHTSLAPSKTCTQCKASFRTHRALKKHADTTKHVAYKCTCEAEFSRLYSLDQHIHDYVAITRSSQEAGEVESGAQDGAEGIMQGGGRVFPCLYCSKYVDEKAFTRKDHLTQHLVGYHKFERGRVQTRC
jgi:Zinc finger, C2H2 type